MYANQLRLLTKETPLPTVVAELWRLYTTVNDGMDHEALVETNTVTATPAGPGSATASFSFAEGPTFVVPGDASNSIALTLKLTGSPGYISAREASRRSRRRFPPIRTASST